MGNPDRAKRAKRDRAETKHLFADRCPQGAIAAEPTTMFRMETGVYSLGHLRVRMRAWNEGNESAAVGSFFLRTSPV
jgi:hypothetical protein